VLKKTNPMISLSRFTIMDPTFLLAASKDSAVMVQKMAVSRAANSPI